MCDEKTFPHSNVRERDQMHLTGFEPALLSETEPKSVAYASFATGADAADHTQLLLLYQFRRILSSCMLHVHMYRSLSVCREQILF